jgi:hypothetical protein
MAAQPRAEFIELQMGKGELAEGAFMQALSMCSSASEPVGDGGMPDAKDPFCCREIQPFGQRTQHEGHPLRGRFQPIHRRMDTSTERVATRLTAKPLDSLGFSVAPIAHDGMDIRIADRVVLAGLIGTGEALGLHADGALLVGFSPHAKDGLGPVLVSQMMSGRQQGNR